MTPYIYCSDDSSLDEFNGEDPVVGDSGTVEESGLKELHADPNDCDSGDVSKEKVVSEGLSDNSVEIPSVIKDGIRQGGFSYDPIDLGGPSFRLLRLLKGRDPSIPCELFTARLQDRERVISYESISYVWGSQDREYSVVLNKKKFGVTRSLHDALCFLQLKDKDRIVWVDAICIDQENDVECGHQVRHMGDVYSEAESVIYWLGPPGFDTNCCLRALRRLEEEARRTVSKTWTGEQWMAAWTHLEASDQTHPGLERKGLEELLCRPWFRRVWILQEVAKSKAASVYCGNEFVSARIFRLAPSLLGVAPEPDCQGILDMMPGPFRASSWFGGCLDLYTLLENIGGSEATRDKDLVYALLALASDAINIIQPDYEKTDEDVVETVFSFLFHVKPRLGIRPNSLRDLCTRLTFWNERALELAAMDELDGDAAMAHNLDRRPRLPISEWVVRAVAKNKGKGSQILEAILTNLERLSRELPPGYVTALVKEAISNDVSGDEVLRTLFSKTTYRPSVTEEFFSLAAGNRPKGVAIIKILLQYCPIDSPPNKRIKSPDKNNDGSRLGSVLHDRVIEAVQAKDLNKMPDLISMICRASWNQEQIIQECVRDTHFVGQFDIASKNELLGLAVSHGYHGLVEDLITAGADVGMQCEIMSHDGAIPLLHCAVGRGHIETVNKLLRAGADIDARADNGETALHIAAQFGRMTITAMLLASGAKIRAKDNEGHTPRLLAQEKGPSNFECLFDLAWPREIQSREKIPVIPDITPESHSTKSPYSFTGAFRKFSSSIVQRISKSEK